MERKNTIEYITEDLYEIITGLSGHRDVDHDRWEKEAKEHFKNLNKNANITLCENSITYEYGGRKLFKIIISKHGQ